MFNIPVEQAVAKYREEKERMAQNAISINVYWPGKERAMSTYILPDFSSAALITIDMQQDTLDGQPLEIPGTTALLPTLKSLLQSFRAAGKPIIHLIRIYQPDGSNVDLCRREQVEQGVPMLLAGSSGCEIAPELLPDQSCRLHAQLLLTGQIQRIGPHEVVIYKPRWRAFYQTPLETYLRQYGISTVIFTGCNFPNCPRTSIYQASERDFRVVVVEDAISGIYERGKEELRNIGITIARAEEVREYLVQAVQH